MPKDGDGAGALKLYEQQALGKLGKAELALEGKGVITVDGHRFNAPRRLKTAGTVFTRMLRSRKTDQRSRYRKSSRTRSSKSSSERPEICHSPVIPGRTR